MRRKGRTAMIPRESSPVPKGLTSNKAQPRFGHSKIKFPWYNELRINRDPIKDPYDYNQSWWRHQMETFSALLALCVEISPVTDKFSSQRPVARSFNVFFDLGLNIRLSKHRGTGDLIRHRAYYDLTVVSYFELMVIYWTHEDTPKYGPHGQVEERLPWIICRKLTPR